MRKERGESWNKERGEMIEKREGGIIEQGEGENHGEIINSTEGYISTKTQQNTMYLYIEIMYCDGYCGYRDK